MSISPQVMEHVRSGNIEGVQAFLDVNPSKSDIQKMISVAAMNGHTACVKMMLPHSLVSGSHMKHNDALVWAANNGHVECVELLIPESSLRGRNSALCAAVEVGHQNCIELLLAVSDPIAALEELQLEYSEQPGLYEVLEHAIAQRQKQILEDTVGDISSARGVRKI